MGSKQVLMTALVACLTFASCSRSNTYRNEQTYYRDNQEIYNGFGNATKRAENFARPKTKIYVLPFFNETPFGNDEFGHFAASDLVRELRNSSKVIVPEDIRTTMVSRDFYAGDKVRLTPLIREAKRLGVSLIIVGKIRKIVFRKRGGDVGLFRSKKMVGATDIEMRIFDTAGEKEILYDLKSSDSTASQVQLFGGNEDSNSKGQREELVQQALRTGMLIFAEDTLKAVEKMNWEGRIAKISGGRLFINAGRASGLNIGDILKVMTSGEDIYDPVTGVYLGRSGGQPKGTLEIVDFLGVDGAVATVHSGGGFFESDLVQLY